MAQQTAVEWLLEQIYNQKIEFIITDMGILISQEENILIQAKQMEKEQIMNAVYDTMEFDPSIEAAEKYYNKTYNK
jgi:hypothetical protein